jgi:hypothetical protein
VVVRFERKADNGEEDVKGDDVLLRKGRDH